VALTDEQLLDAGMRSGLIDPPVLERLRIDARRQRVPVLGAVQAYYRFPLSALYRAVAEQRGVPYIDLNTLPIDGQLLKKIPPSLVRRKLILPVVDNDRTMLAVADPGDRGMLDSVQRLLGLALPVVMADLSLLQLKITQALASKGVETASGATADDADLVAMLDTIVREAYYNRASDIHLLTETTGLRVRLRVDGKLRDYPVDANGAIAPALVSRVKVLSGLDIAEQRMPQDGGFSYHLAPPIDKAFNI